MAYLHGTTIKVTPLHPDGRVRPEYPIVLLRDVREGEEWRANGAYGLWQNTVPFVTDSNGSRWVEVRKATPKTEIVPWHEAAGRWTVSGGYIASVTRDSGGRIEYTLLDEGRHDRKRKSALLNDRQEFTVLVED